MGGDMNIPRSYPRESKVRTYDHDEPVSNGFMARGINALLGALGDLGGIIQDHNHPFDEYQPNGVTDPDTEITTLTCQPEYEYGEMCESIMVTGPADAAFTLSVGHRSWSLIMPAQQCLIIGPVLIELQRDSTRQLSSAIAGDWTLEIMGYARVSKFDVGGYLFR